MASILSWPGAERPREKMIRKGASALSDAELLALLLRSGCRGCDATALGRQLLQESGGLRGLLAREPARLLGRFRGLGPAKAAALAAVSELARRLLREDVTGSCYVRDPESVIQYLMLDLRDRKKEVFKVLFLDKGNRILETVTLFTGTVDQTAVHPREIIHAAFERHACALILAHNHPSGRVEPSREDRELTSRLQKLCEGLSIRILDHLIIGDNRYYSFREQGLLT